MKNKKRIFFALWPDDVVRQGIMQLLLNTPQAQNMGWAAGMDAGGDTGRIFKVSNLHLTLHFIGQVSETQLSCLDQAAAGIKFASFSLDLDSYGAFEKAKVFWTGPSEKLDVLKELHTQLASAISQCDFVPDSREFTPHVTLMRNVKQSQNMSSLVLKKPASIIWEVKKFALVESVSTNDGVEYKPVKMYDLV